MKHWPACPNRQFPKARNGSNISTNAQSLPKWRFTPMKCRLPLVAVTMLLVTGIPLFAMGPAAEYVAPAGWVACWAKPRVILFGPEEQAFYQNMHEVTFAHDRFDHA